MKTQRHKNKQESIDETLNRAKLSSDEFSFISEVYKDKLVDDLDKGIALMKVYQLGWLKLISNWKRK